MIENQALLALVSETHKQELRDLLIEELQDALLCSRVWEAWSVNTMSEDDFHFLTEDAEFIEELTVKILLKLSNTNR